MPVKFQTYANSVKLAANQSLHFQPGKGYYAGPILVAPGPGPAEPKAFQGGQPYVPPRSVTPRRTVGPAPTPPTDPYGALSASALDTRATDLANSGLTPQQDEIRRQQALATAHATADEAAITGFQTAAGQLMGDIAPMVGQGYRDAAATVGAIGTNVGGQVGADLAARQQADDAFAASQGQSGGHSNDPTATGATVGYLGGVIPGEDLAHEGAAAQERAARDVAIPLNAGREELAARMAQATQENDSYAQQLIQLAAQFPGLKAQALQQLNQYELDKANYRDNLRVHNEQIAASRADTKRQDRAEVANEKAAGLTAAYKTADMNYRWASLEFQSQKAVAAAKAAAAKGKRIDVSASKLLGHIVYQDGSESPNIKVKQTTGATTDPAVKARVNRAKATQTARTDAFKFATKILGTPVATDKTVKSVARAKGAQVGQYVAAPTEKYGVRGGVFPPAYTGAPATTNNPARAARTGAGATDYNDAQQKVWAQIGGDSLMARFGYSREQVMAIVNRALAAAGWRRAT